MEGIPNAIMEAMALVASNVGGIPDLVRHGQDGFQDAPADVAAMAQSVMTLMDDAVLRTRQGRAGGKGYWRSSA